MLAWAWVPTNAATPAVHFFRPRRVGPEAALEDAVTRIADTLIDASPVTWIAGSLPIGAGLPDLSIIGFAPEVANLKRVRSSAILCLGYLRGVRAASPQTISRQTQRQLASVHRDLEALQDLGAIRTNGKHAYQVAPRWRLILSSVTTVETKVSDWRSAVSQASRNRIFSHRSYVALPSAIAHRVSSVPSVSTLGLGVIEINEDGTAKVHRTAKQRSPSVWSYYYTLARVVAQEARI